MSEASEAIVSLFGLCLALFAMFVWFLLLPTVGLLYMIGYLT